MLAFALWSIGALIAAGYCIVRGIGSAAIFLLTPIQTNAVKMVMPIASPR